MKFLASRRIVALGWFLSLVPLTLAVPAAAGDQPLLESVKGARTVTVTNASGQREAGEGDALAPGDRIQTGRKVSARVVYADGSQLLVGRASDVEISERDSGGTQWNRLHHGNVRSIVAKPKSVSGKKPPYRFGIKTRSAVMGVRGTDFVTETDPSGEKSELHTMDGEVHVAKDEDTLLSGKGLAVAKDQYIQSALGTELPKPQKFDHGKYLNELKQKQPDFQGFVNKAPRPRAELEKLHGRADEAAKNASAKKEELKGKAAEKLKAPEAPPVKKPVPPKNPFRR